MLTALVNRIRCNHTLEHATINLITQHYPSAQVLGISGPLGFTLYTTLPAEEVTPAAIQALKRLKGGESALRLHANCGTNMVVTATLTTAAALLGVGNQSTLRGRLEHLPQAILLSVFALLAARPVGEWVQAHITTATDLAQVEIASIFTDYQGGLRRIRVYTRQSA
ncbi:MAG TPA: DUF6391 domain-containing protein [Anaerolineae bacterium]|nr:DUF6391 domain-containing protein [Anaerolineae bacterium]